MILNHNTFIWTPALTWKSIIWFIKNHVLEIWTTIVKNARRHLPSGVSVEIRVSDMTVTNKCIDTFFKQSRHAWDLQESWDMHKQIEQWNFSLNEVASYVLKYVDPQEQGHYADAIHDIVDMQLKQVWLRSHSYKLDKKIIQKIQWLHEVLSFDPKYTWLFMSCDKKINSLQTTIVAIWLTSFAALAILDHAPQNNDTETHNSSTILVKKWDTLYKLARQYGTTVRQIKDSNNLKSDNIWVGQRLFVANSN